MNNIKYFAPSAVLLAIVAIAAALLLPGTQAHANPFYAGTRAVSAAATTTVSYLTPGLATSTVVYDSYEANGTNQANGGNQTLPDSLAVLVQGNASSTLTTLTLACEFGLDNPASGLIDWYQNEVLGATTTNAGVQNISVPNSMSFTYASSTVGGTAGTGSTSRFAKAFVCPVPTRYVRAVISDTGAGASVWTALVPKKQRN